MSVSSIKELEEHISHDIAVVIYGAQDNAAIECESCSMVIESFNNAGDQAADYDRLSDHAHHVVDVVMKHDRTVVECVVCDDELLAFRIEDAGNE